MSLPPARSRALHALLCAILAGLPCQALHAQASRRAPASAPAEFRVRRLGNGLTVYALRDTHSPTVMVSMWYDVGARNDPDGFAGMAHLFEHLLSRKTVNMPYNMLNQMVGQAGGTRNAFTNYDYTHYDEIVPPSHLEAMLWSHAERMARVVFDSVVLESERKALSNEIRERVLANPYGPPGRLTSLVTPFHSLDVAPHRRPTVGDSAELARATVADVQAFHEAYYGPESATLIVAGNFDDALLDAWVDRYLGAIPRRRAPVASTLTPEEPARTTARTVYEYVPNLPSPAVVASWKTPSSGHADLPALAVLNAILVTGDHARLRQAIVDRGLATLITDDLRDTRDVGYDAFIAVARLASDSLTLERALLAEVDKLRTTLVTTSEVAEAKAELAANQLRQRETLPGRVREIGDGLSRTHDPHHFERWLAQVRKVTVADVRRVANTYLRPEQRVVVRYRDASTRGQLVAGDGALPLPRFRRLDPSRTPPRTVAADAVRQPPPPPRPTAPPTPLVASDATLPSGLRVVAVQSGRVPLGTVAVTIRGGSASDPAGQEGISALLTDVVRAGTAAHSATGIAAALEALGATLVTTAEPDLRDIQSITADLAQSADGVTLAVTAPLTQLDRAARILAALVQHPALRDEDIGQARTRAVARMAGITGSSNALSALVLHQALATTTGRALDRSGQAWGVGRVATIQALTAADLRAHHRRWWHPANATVVITGGMDTREAQRMARRLFGGWHASGTSYQPGQARGNDQPGRTILVDIPGASQATVAVGVALDSAVTRGDGQAQATVLNMLLGLGSTSRLFVEVRTRRGLSYGPTSWFAPRAGGGVLAASAATTNEHAVEAADVIVAGVERLARESASAEEVAAGKRLAGGFLGLVNGTSASLARFLAGAVQRGVDPSLALRLALPIGDVTPESLRSLMARTLGARPAMLVVAGDARRLADALRAQHPNLEILTATDLVLSEQAAP